MIRKKSSVNIDNLNPLLMQFAEDMSNQFDGIVITSGNDSVHMIGSRHYIDKAIDIGANSSEANAFAGFKSYAIGNEDLKAKYQIEDLINEGDHIHIELPLTVKEAEVVAEKKNFLMGGIGFIIIGVFGFLAYKKGLFK